MKASDLFVECLEKEGVEFIFGIPGIEILDLMESLSKSRIRFVSVRTETGAAFMADAYGQVTGKAGVCVAASGASATNLTTALACAKMDHSPVVAITGQKNLTRVQREPYQVIDTVATLRPVCKWNAQINRPELIPEFVHRAFKRAQIEPVGVSHLELPEDVAKADTCGRPFEPASLRLPSPPDRVLDGAAELIDEAERIIILAGHGAVRCDASSELAAFVDELGIPVISTPNAKGVLPFDHPRFCYTVDIHCEPVSLEPFKNAEVVIALGYEMDEFPPDLWNPEGAVKIIHMSASPAEINRNYQVSVEVVGDIRDSLRNLRSMVRKRNSSHVPNPYKEKIYQTLSQFENDGTSPMKPQRVMAELGRVLQPDDLLICDMGSHRFWVSQLFPAPGSGSVILSQSHGATGFALPGAIGASLAMSSRRVIALCGDGGFLSGCAELTTATKLQLPVVVLIMNDQQLSYIRSLQVKRFQHPVGTDVVNPDFAALARAFGAKGISANSETSLSEVIQQAFLERCPTVIDVPIDSKENERIFDNWLQAF